MKKSITTTTIAFITTLSLITCGKEETFGDGRAENLPDSVAIGQSLIFLNGEQVPFLSNFDIGAPGAGVSGSFNHYDEGIADDLQFYVDPIHLGFFEPKLQFGRTNGDSNFELYKQVDRDSAFLEVTFVDTFKQEIQGRFEGRFKKTLEAKGTRKKKYPDDLLIQCVFNEKYKKF